MNTLMEKRKSQTKEEMQNLKQLSKVFSIPHSSVQQKQPPVVVPITTCLPNALNKDVKAADAIIPLCISY